MSLSNVYHNLSLGEPIAQNIILGILRNSHNCAPIRSRTNPFQVFLLVS